MALRRQRQHRPDAETGVLGPGIRRALQQPRQQRDQPRPLGRRCAGQPGAQRRAAAQQLEACIAAADRIIVNDGTIPEFRRKLEEVA